MRQAEETDDRLACWKLDTHADQLTDRLLDQPIESYSSFTLRMCGIVDRRVNRQIDGRTNSKTDGHTIVHTCIE